MHMSTFFYQTIMAVFSVYTFGTFLLSQPLPSDLITTEVQIWICGRSTRLGMYPCSTYLLSGCSSLKHLPETYQTLGTRKPPVRLPQKRTRVVYVQQTLRRRVKDVLQTNQLCCVVDMLQMCYTNVSRRIEDVILQSY